LDNQAYTRGANYIDRPQMSQLDDSGTLEASQSGNGSFEKDEYSKVDDVDEASYSFQFQQERSMEETTTPHEESEHFSEVSSPFISHPELLSSKTVSLNENLLEQTPVRSQKTSTTDDVDASIASLRETLAKLRTGDAHTSILRESPTVIPDDREIDVKPAKTGSEMPTKSDLSLDQNHTILPEEISPLKTGNSLSTYNSDSPERSFNERLSTLSRSNTNFTKEDSLIIIKNSPKRPTENPDIEGSIKSHEISSKPHDTSFHNSTIDTTRYNDTQVQLDQDITLEKETFGSTTLTQETFGRPSTIPYPIEKPTLETFDRPRSLPQETAKAFKNTTPKTSITTTATTSTTPSNWRKLQTASRYNPITEIPNLPSFNPKISTASNFKQNPFQPQDVSTASKIDDLNKQITGYRIQIKFFKQFLQNLIDKSRPNDLAEPVFDYGELQCFQQNFDGLSPHQKGDYNKLQLDYNTLLQNYDEVFKLNEDLYENLEGFQYKIRSKDDQTLQMNEYLQSCTILIDDILQVLIHDQNTDVQTRQALTKCMESSISNRPLEIKLHGIRFQIEKFLETWMPRAPSSDSEQREIMNYIDTIHNLKDYVQNLETGQKLEMDRIDQDLKEEIENTKLIKMNNQMMSQMFNKLCTMIEEKYSFSEEHLRLENERLLVINKASDEKFQKYTEIINSLQQEVNEVKNGSEVDERRESLSQINKSLNSDEHDLHSELLDSHRIINQMHEEFNELSNKYKKLKDDSSKTISSLTNQLQGKTHELSLLKTEARVAEKLKDHLDLAGEKERRLQTEKIQLSHRVETLSKEKESLQATIGSLTDKITTLTVDDQYGSGEKLKRVAALEFHLKEVLQFDLRNFLKMLKSLDKIADDKSVETPTRKVEILSKKLRSNENIMEDTNYVRELHKSVFDYFSTALEMLVNEHVKVLLNESEDSNGYVDKLLKHIDELHSLNETLSKEVEEYENLETHDSTSPISKLKMDELTKRWKSEREKRILETKQANRRLAELESEKAALQAELERQNRKNDK
jgi:hypothetical protein